MRVHRKVGLNVLLCVDRLSGDKKHVTFGENNFGGTHFAAIVLFTIFLDQPFTYSRRFTQ